MGRPRMIIVIRHAQSEGNRNRSIHQTVPDHRVKLTPEGWGQAEEAGRRLRSMLKPDDTIRIYTSPYRRTRETTDGILRTLTSDENAPSPFPRHTIKVWEEPRLREQDFGNFQPCSAAMERMWQERADYGHFFYRIPNGESAADAYDRISGFNESLWRDFAEEDFPSVCVLVTHGLMSRVFLMKWFHWSVEYFEDLRNVNHCEFVVMKRSLETRKFVLLNDLRTWSELKRQAAAENKKKGILEDDKKSDPVPKKQWGGCPEGCTHEHDHYPRRPKRQDTIVARPAPAKEPADKEPGSLKPSKTEEEDEAFPQTFKDQQGPASNQSDSLRGGSTLTPSDLPQRLREEASNPVEKGLRPKPQWLRAGRDAGGSESGMATPAIVETDDSKEYGFPDASTEGAEPRPRHHSRTPSALQREWIHESGMGKGARADALGDTGSESDAEGAGKSSDLEEQEKEDKGLRGSVY